MKPSKHYEDLRQALNLYRDDDYKTFVDCVAHVLLDIQVWTGDVKTFYAAVRRSGELAIAQHEQAIEWCERKLRENETEQGA